MKKLWCSGLINGFESFISGCPVENVPISKRAWLPLRRSGIHTLGDLRIIGKEGLHNTRWVGAENKEEILSTLGWLFGDSLTEDIVKALKKRKWSDERIKVFLDEIGLDL